MPDPADLVRFAGQCGPYRTMLRDLAGIFMHRVLRASAE